VPGAAARGCCEPCTLVPGVVLRGGGLTGGFGGGLGVLAICFTFWALAAAVQQVHWPLVVANELIRTHPYPALLGYRVQVSFLYCCRLHGPCASS
jgi:hypothetical protein